MTEEHQLATGQVLDGKYKIEETLGQGGMGLVYRAQHLGLNASRAIKVMHRKFAENEDFLRRFRNEARLAEGLRHPNLVTLYDLSPLPDGSWYIVWEYVEGETLASLLEKGVSFGHEEVTELIGQVADGLSAAHRQRIVHRDISPDNLMVTRDAEGRAHVKVLDFGIAKAVDDFSVAVQNTATGMFLGKPGYCSPEQISLEPNEALDARTDVFSLAVVTYQLLTGKRPFRTSSVRTYFYEVMTAPELEIRDRYEKDLPPAFRGAICRALSRDRNTRTPTMAQFKVELMQARDKTGTAMGHDEAARVTVASASTGSPDGGVPAHGAGAPHDPLEEDRATIILPSNETLAPSPQDPATNARPARQPVKERAARITSRQLRGNTSVTRRWGWIPKLALGLPLLAIGLWLVWGRLGPDGSRRAATPSEANVPQAAAESAVPTTLSRDEPSSVTEETQRPPGVQSDATPQPPRTGSSLPVEARRPTPRAAAGGSDPATSSSPTEPATSSPAATPRATRRPAAALAGLSIDSTPPAEVRLDGREIGRTPISAEVAPGAHRVELRTDSGQRWSRSFTARAGVTTNLSPRLDQFGSLSVTANVWANIRLDDSSLEQTPAFYRRVLVGEHSVLVTRDGYVEQRLSVEINEGETTSLRIAMQELR